MLIICKERRGLIGRELGYSQRFGFFLKKFEICEVCVVFCRIYLEVVQLEFVEIALGRKS